MYELKKLVRYFRVNLLGPDPRLTKKNLPGRGLTEVEIHSYSQLLTYIAQNILVTATTFCLHFVRVPGNLNRLCCYNIFSW